MGLAQHAVLAEIHQELTRLKRTCGRLSRKISELKSRPVASQPPGDFSFSGADIWPMDGSIALHTRLSQKYLWTLANKS
jgi:hypothetical protein